MKIKTDIMNRRWVLSLVPVIAGIFCFGVLSLQSAPDQGPDPETIKAVEKFMRVMKVRESLQPTVESLKKMQDALIDQEEISDEEKVAAKQEAAEMSKESTELLTWDNIGEMLVRVYAEVFTTEEMNGLIKLFESPAGQVYVKKQDQLRRATMEEMQKLMLELMPKFNENSQKAVERVKKKQAKEK